MMTSFNFLDVSLFTRKLRGKEEYTLKKNPQIEFNKCMHLALQNKSSF